MEKNTRNRGYMAFFAVVLFLTAFSGLTWAENVDLVTVPIRDGVQLTIYNSEDLTLVREVRTLSFKKGMNQLQFSWANTLIDPTSIDFRPLEHKGELEIVDTLYPGDEPTHLIWNINSEYEGQVKVLVNYFISGLNWNMEYILATNTAETSLTLDGYITVGNVSGENFEDAQVRVIVGRVNLVERIRTLAARRRIPVPAKVSREYDKLKREALIEDIEEYEYEDDEFDERYGASRKGGSSLSEGHSVSKRRISDYYIFSVSGTQTVENKCLRKMRALQAKDVTFDTVYRYWDYMNEGKPVKYFILKNDAEHKLGECPLPRGILRAYRKNVNGSLSYLAGQYLDYCPIKSDVEIKLGSDKQVDYETNFYDVEYDNFEFGRKGFEFGQKVEGWTEKQTHVSRVRNFSNKPIRFELRESWRGDVEYSSDLEATLFSVNIVETIFTVEPGEEKVFNATLKVNMGTRKKQDRVELKK